ncbi:MAG: MAPEG family protein [Pseudomonadota bacterium]
MAAHIVWVVLLYALLTLVRAPSVWGLFRSSDGGNPWADIERRVSANLSNQFEWPMLFYAVCVLLLQQHSVDAVQLWLAWLFVAGRLLHSIVQIGSANVRLRGIVFTINFVAVLAMWGRLLASAWA